MFLADKLLNNARNLIFDLGLQKKFEPKIQKKPGFFGFWAQNIFGGLNTPRGSIALMDPKPP